MSYTKSHKDLIFSFHCHLDTAYSDIAVTFLFLIFLCSNCFDMGQSHREGSSKMTSLETFRHCANGDALMLIL